MQVRQSRSRYSQVLVLNFKVLDFGLRNQVVNQKLWLLRQQFSLKLVNFSTNYARKQITASVRTL